jgi:hypothetical protein
MSCHPWDRAQRDAALSREASREVTSARERPGRCGGGGDDVVVTNTQSAHEPARPAAYPVVVQPRFEGGAGIPPSGLPQEREALPRDLRQRGRTCFTMRTGWARSLSAGPT